MSDQHHADYEAADAIELGDAAGEIEREGFAEAFAVNRCLSRTHRVILTGLNGKSRGS